MCSTVSERARIIFNSVGECGSVGEWASHGVR